MKLVWNVIYFAESLLLGNVIARAKGELNFTGIFYKISFGTVKIVFLIVMWYVYTRFENREREREKKKKERKKKKYCNVTTLEYISRWFSAFKSFTSLSCYFYPFFILHHLTRQSTLPYPPRPRISHHNIFYRVSKKIISLLLVNHTPLTILNFTIDTLSKLNPTFTLIFFFSLFAFHFWIFPNGNENYTRCSFEFWNNYFEGLVFRTPTYSIVFRKRLFPFFL